MTFPAPRRGIAVVPPVAIGGSAVFIVAACSVDLLPTFTAAFAAACHNRPFAAAVERPYLADCAPAGAALTRAQFPDVGRHAVEVSVERLTVAPVDLTMFVYRGMRAVLVPVARDVAMRVVFATAFGGVLGTFCWGMLVAAAAKKGVRTKHTTETEEEDFLHRRRKQSCIE